jgi:hypothetical protein
MGRWIEFKDNQRPRLGEIIAIKNESRIYPYLVKVKENGWYGRLEDEGILVDPWAFTHWILIETNY